MSNSNTPNEQPCLRPSDENRASCDCPICVCRESRRAEAAARAPETATQYILREFAEALARRTAEESRLRAFLRDCRCPCCQARSRLRTISYDRAEHSAADIHCASTDRRDDNEDSRLAADAAASEKEYRDNARDSFARAGRYADNSDKAIRSATEVSREDSSSGPARDD